MEKIIKPHRKILLAASLGNILEFFDFTLFGIFAPVIAPLFFPSTDILASYLMAFGAFAVGFLARPVGAIIFGKTGDTFGRKNALSLSIILMALSTALIAFAPTYETIGIGASLYLFFCRILQGICAGGEFNGSAVFVLEQLDQGKKGFYGAILVSACIFGTILATLLWMFYKKYAHIENAWRIPFLFGSLIGAVGYYLRQSLKEGPSPAPSTEHSPLKKSLVKNRKEVLVMISIGGLNGCLVYTLFSYSIFYFSKISGHSIQKGTYSSLISLIILITLNPFFGKIGDRIGHVRVMKFASLLIIPFSYLYYNALNNNIYVTQMQIILGILGALYVSNQHAVSVSMFPPSTRYTGTSLGYSIGMALLGGTTPMISTYLIKASNIVTIPFAWMLICSVLSWMCLRFSRLSLGS